MARSGGRPGSMVSKKISHYQIKFSIHEDAKKINQCRQKLGRFILASNQLDPLLLSNAEMLTQYKEQSTVESGFKFIKDNAFELDSVFLKSSSWIGALMMVMTLCLMVYNFAQYHLRECLKAHEDVLPNQVGKPVQKPTMKWIAELMVMIPVVTVQTEETKQRIIVNVNQVHRKIIAYFGKTALKIYGLSPGYQQVKMNYANYKNLLDWCEM